jgi:5'-nucleotidase
MVTGADVWQINAQEAVAYAHSRYNYNATLLFNGDDPFAASDPDPEVIGLTLPSAPAWSASKIYHAGEQVMDNGSTWRALWWTLNQKPGEPYGPWEQIVTTPDGSVVWTPSRIFHRRRRRGPPGQEVCGPVVDPQSGVGAALRALEAGRLIPDGRGFG